MLMIDNVQFQNVKSLPIDICYKMKKKLIFNICTRPKLQVSLHIDDVGVRFCIKLIIKNVLIFLSVASFTISHFNQNTND